MNSQPANQISHWCANCDAHFRLDQVRHCIPVSESALGETEVLQCPVCSSYEIQQLLEPDSATQHCTVVFRLPAAREALGYFLSDLETKFPACGHEIIAVQSGNALAKRGNTE